LGFVLLALGVISALVAGATMYLTKAQEWERAAIAAGCSASCFSLYWAMGQTWFMYLVWAVGAGMVAAVGWFLWRESRQAKSIQAIKERTKEADEAEDALKRIIKAVDEAGESATVAQVRASMGTGMNDNHKALVHELRAETKRTAA
jgi:MFS superfamily sulfate permease-like transporter